MKESTLSDTQDHITKKAFPCLGIRMPGYVDLMEELNHKFPLSEPQIIGVQSQKDFIVRAWPCSSLRSFSLIRKMELWRTKKPPALRVVEIALALCKKPPLI